MVEKVTIVLHKAWRDMTDAEKDELLDQAADKLYGPDEPGDGAAAEFERES